jgi:hypothetical protein
VTDVGKGIVFCVEVDQSPTRATQSFKRSVQAICMTGNCKSLLLEEITDGIMGAMFVEC